MYRGKYQDPATAGQQYAEGVQDIIQECHSKQKKVRTSLYTAHMYMYIVSVRYMYVVRTELVGPQYL